MNRVGVIGIGHGRFGRRDDASVQELAFEAFRAALDDSGLELEAIDASVVASVPEYHRQRSVAGVVQEYLGLNPRPTWLAEAACASGSAAVLSAWTMIRSGLHEIVAVIGAQKMTELSTPEVLALMGRVGEVQWESVFGTTFPGYYAMMARRHMHEHGTTREQLAAVAVKNHHYGASNPHARFRKEITGPQALASEPVAEPLGVYDCCANADGAACLILASERRARALRGDVVWLDGVGCASAPMSILRRADLCSMPSVVEASRRAHAMAGTSPQAVNVAAVHDCFTIAEIIAYEDLGFCGRGEGGAFVADGQAHVGGATPVNLDGGLKAKGHPIGATGVSMAYGIVQQLRGRAGEYQVAGANVGLTHNVGGIGQYGFVNVYRRD